MRIALPALLTAVAFLVSLGCEPLSLVVGDKYPPESESGGGKQDVVAGGGGQAFGGELGGAGGAGDSLGGRGEQTPGLAGVGAEAGAGAVPTCDPVTPPLIPAATAAESAAYGWTNCGRIAAAKPFTDAAFAKDGSVVVVEEGGVVRSFAKAATSGVMLAKAKTGGVSRLSVVAEGTRVVLSGAAAASVLEAQDAAAVGTGGGSLTERVTIDLTSAGCEGPVTSSSDGKRMVAGGVDRACIWDADSGGLLGTRSFSAPEEAEITWPSLAAPTPSGAGLLVFAGGILTTYAPSGGAPSSVPTGTVDLRALAPAERSWMQGVFSADSKTLLLLDSNPEARRSLIAVDTATGATRWRRELAAGYGALAVASDGYVTARGDGLYSIVDGQRLGEAPSIFRDHFELSSSRLELLETRLAVRLWDLNQNRISRLYAGPSSVGSLDLSADGRLLATGGLPSLVWQLAADFSSSVPVLDAAAEGATNVALSPSGDTLLLSGDVVVLARRDGSVTRLAQDAEVDPQGGLCLLNRWDYSPDGCSVAGLRYTTELRVHDAARGAEQVKRRLGRCADVAFSPDGSRLMTAELELFDTRDWSLIWSKADSQPSQGLFTDRPASIAYSPDGLGVVITRCSDSQSEGCESTLYDAATGNRRLQLPALPARQVRYSPEGHWLVSGGTLFHLPTGTTRQYGSEAIDQAIFTPEGDIIAGAADDSLVRYCRSE